MGSSIVRWTAPLGLSILVAFGLTACGDDKKSTTTAEGSPTMSITMKDYDYTVSGPMVVGGTMKIANQGQEFHMMGVGKLKPGKTLADFQTALQNEQPNQQDDPTKSIVDDTGLPGNVMGPGQSAELTVPSLKSGTYAMVCFIPTEGEGVPHFKKGMVSQFEIVDGTAPPAPTADASYKIAAGQAIEGPATLSAGAHTLKFDAASGSQQLEPAVGKVNPGATFEQLDDALNQTFEGEQPPPKGFASQLPGQVVFGGFDLRDITTFYLRLNFTPGSYGLVAEDTDVKDRPKPPKEFLALTVT